MNNRSLIRDACRDERGVAATEFAVILPMILILFMSAVSVFDMFRVNQSVKKATYTIGDLISRQTVFDEAKGAFMWALFNQLARRGRPDGAMRTSSYVMKKGVYTSAWSVTKGAAASTSDTVVSNLPASENGDSVVVVETFAPHESILAVLPLPNLTFKNIAVYRPRFVTAIVKQ